MIPKFLLEAVDSVINKPDVKDIPVGDISHHDMNLTEGALHTWLNGTQPEDSKIPKDYTVRRRVEPVPDTPELRNLSEKHVSNLNLDDVRTINKYVGDSFRVNNILVARHNDTDGSAPSIGSIKDRLAELDTTLSKNKLEKPLTTYSGLGFNPKDKIFDSKGNLKSDGLLHLPAYTSSSTHRATAKRFARVDAYGDDSRHIIELTHPKGSTGAYISSISKIDEKEHISPRGMTIKINPKPDIHTDAEGNTLHVWKAKRLLSYEK